MKVWWLMMIDAIVEISVNIFQSCMYIGFLFLLFNKEKKTKKDYIGFFSFVAILFIALTYFSFNPIHFTNLDEIIYTCIQIVYAVFLLKGNIFARIIMPIISQMINTVISYGFAFTISCFTPETVGSLVLKASIYRYLCMGLITLTNILVLLIILRFNKTEFKFKKWTDIVSFLVIPVMSVLIIYSCVYISILTELNPEIVGLLTFICLSMTAIAVITWFMMTKISKSNEIKTKLLLTEQREQLYKEDILHTNEQIENMSKTKHDMKNNILCLSRLIADSKYEEAEEFCNSISENLEAIYTPISTNDPLLNAIINVERDKALNSKIDFRVSINEQVVSDIKSNDIVSIVGNMCDNAIEYLRKQPENKRKMTLDISYKKSYIVITCKNKISESILSLNPDLATTKKDKVSHGKGMGIISDCVKKYNGDIRYYEKDNYLYVSAIIHSNRISN